jgi:hypothetical protein
MNVLSKVVYFIEHLQEGVLLSESESEALASAKSLLVCYNEVSKSEERAIMFDKILDEAKDIDDVVGNFVD